MIDVASRKVTNHLVIPAQDPRAIIVRHGKLYVVPFESNNKTQLSGGYKIDGDLVTFNAHDHSIANNNILYWDTSLISSSTLGFPTRTSSSSIPKAMNSSKPSKPSAPFSTD